MPLRQVDDIKKLRHALFFFAKLVILIKKQCNKSVKFKIEFGI
jgi:hypothetical protein